MLKTAMLTVVFLPLLIPVWKKEPLDQRNTNVPQLPTFIEESAIREQVAYYKTMRDPRIRSQIATSLSYANNAAAVAALEDMLSSETHEKVVSDILNAIRVYKGKVTVNRPELMKRLLEHSDPRIRAYAAEILFDKTGDPKDSLSLIQKENSDFVVNFLTENMMNAAKPVSPSEESLQKLAESDNATIRNRGLFLLAYFSRNPDSVATLVKSAESPVVNDRRTIAEALALRLGGGEKFLRKLADDPSDAVRGSVGNMVANPEREAIFLHLTQDRDWETRRLACVGLANYRDDRSVRTLVEMCKDPVLAVRSAAEDSLIALRPGEDARKALRDLIEDKTAGDSAIRILGGIEDSSAAAPVLAALKKTDRDETRKRAIFTLGQLDFKDSAGTVCGFATSEDTAVRHAVVSALERFAVPSSFATLVTLSKDRITSVSLAAIKAMGEIADPYFNDRLFELVKDVSPTNLSEKRSAACWSLARINRPTQAMATQMRTLATKKVIVIEGIANYDSDYTRLSCSLALIEFAKKDPAYKDAAESVTSSLKDPPLLDPDFNTEILRAFGREAYAYMKGEESKPTALGHIPGDLVIKPFQEKKQPTRVIPPGM